MADDGAARKVGDVLVGDSGRVLEFVGEASESGAEDEGNERAKRAARENVAGG